MMYFKINSILKVVKTDKKGKEIKAFINPKFDKENEKISFYLSIKDILTLLKIILL